MMMALLLLELAEGRTPAELAPHAVPENRAGRDLCTRGTVRGMHLRQDKPGAVLALEVADAGQARRVADALPMVAAGLLAAELVPLAPFKPLEALFAT
jgi:hypothetical protein